MPDPGLLGAVQQWSSQALGWLHAAHEVGRGHFSADGSSDLSDDVDETYKPLSECALAASLVLREGVAGARDTEIARRMIEFCWNQLGQGDVLYERQLRHLMLSDPMEVYQSFVVAGLRHRQLDELLASSATLRAPHVGEVLPNRRLAIANARRVLGVGPEPDWTALASATWLGATPEPWALDFNTAYDVTHTVFHLTDWGAVPSGLPEPMRRYLRQWLPVWVDVWTELGQWDLVGELLFADACIGDPQCPAEAWEPLLAVQHPDGLTPRDNDPVEDDAELAFKNHEHTAVVAVAAGTLTLARALGSSPAPPR
ncbi:hypothetical protein AB0M97_28545 [Streptomyces sp. NPDC051207]|uniref:DUF6895 family protein n=1 Tax=Streptomyces sp. NPDC051207 TaxID=3154641 RepID=UPI003447A833